MLESQTSSTLTGDHACARCGYNLRGLTRGGLCPECAAPVGDSLRGNLLHHQKVFTEAAGKARALQSGEVDTVPPQSGL